MEDLNSLLLFTEVVAHGGFAAAGRALGEPKSSLSRRIARLEAELGVLLIARTTRHFQVTEIGRRVYERGRLVAAEVERTRMEIAQALRDSPTQLRVTGSAAALSLLSAATASFVMSNRDAHVQVNAPDPTPRFGASGCDVVLELSAAPASCGKNGRLLGSTYPILVAAPALSEQLAALHEPSDLDRFPCVAGPDDGPELGWVLTGNDAIVCSVRGEARLRCSTSAAQREAAELGAGIACLPWHVCLHALQRGRLRRVLPEWRGSAIHLCAMSNVDAPSEIAEAYFAHLAQWLEEAEPQSLRARPRADEASDLFRSVAS